MMRFDVSFLSSLLLLSSCSFGVVAQSNEGTIDFNDCCNNAQEATAFAIAYATPLVAYANFTSFLLDGIGGPNRIIPQQTLSDPSVRNVVKPNVDTVYTLSFIDLSQSDLVITVPEISDGRYWSFPFYDPYGNQFAELSSINAAPPGIYLIRRTDDANTLPGLELTTPTTSSIPKYNGIINFPTTHGTLLSRILVRENSTTDLDTVHSYQRGVQIGTTSRTLTNANLPQAPILTPELLDTSSISDPNIKALTLLTRMGSFNQPTVASDRYRIGLILGQAGIAALSSSQYTPPAGINLTAAQTTALTSTQSTVQSPTNLNILTNNWVLQNLATQGDFGTDYASRYYIALNGYLQLVASETLYPSYAPAQIGGTSLGAREAYLFTFFGRPPVLPLQGQSGMQGGFWSLTAYGADQFLIPNQLGRYEIGDRSGITYEDGSAVYPSANESSASPANDTKTFQVLLQPQDVTPPANWTKNWLPAPAGGGELLFLLRFYAPSPSLSNGEYEYPRVEKVAAITRAAP